MVRESIMRQRQIINIKNALLLGILFLISIPVVIAGENNNLTKQQQYQFLYQTTFGPTPQNQQQLDSLGITAWLEYQFSLPFTSHQTLYLTPFPKGEQANRENAWYQISIQAEDQLRQRMAFALSQIVVVSRYGGQFGSRAQALSQYYDQLGEHAFGNYRELLKEIAISPVMGSYLSMMGSKKENTSTGALPDENFARELMQLFTLGLYQINMDGSFKTTNGKRLATYHQHDIQELARALTGWSRSDYSYLLPMKANARTHDSGEKLFLGHTIPAGMQPEAELDLVLDIIFQHPNVAPFISRLLIQRFTTSNPSPEYIERVANVFANNGAGVRGDLKAVLSAILTDPQAKAGASKIKEPILVLTQFHRAFELTPTSERLINAVTFLNVANQGGLRAPSVFNFYSPDFAPQGEFEQNGLVAPEFELLDWNVYTQVVNYMYYAIKSNNDPTMSMNLAPYYERLDQHQALVDLINERLFGDAMSDALKSLLLNTLNDYPESYVAKTKLSQILFLALSSEEFFIQK
ncbi:DUF1800 domain-containing protein [Vibrio vulnificus]